MNSISINFSGSTDKNNMVPLKKKQLKNFHILKKSNFYGKYTIKREPSKKYLHFKLYWNKFFFWKNAIIMLNRVIIK